jgi:hypothetical protein
MKRSLTLLSALLLVPLATLHADDTAKLAAILAPATVHGGTVTIPPGGLRNGWHGANDACLAHDRPG